MPVNFAENFPSTKVKWDATEIPIQKSSNVNSRSVTWSTYKHRNTIKAIIGVTPIGAFSYVSDAYGGPASDRMIIERSELLNKGSTYQFQPFQCVLGRDLGKFNTITAQVDVVDCDYFDAWIKHHQNVLTFEPGK